MNTYNIFDEEEFSSILTPQREDNQDINMENYDFFTQQNEQNANYDNFLSDIEIKIDNKNSNLDILSDKNTAVSESNQRQLDIFFSSEISQNTSDCVSTKSEVNSQPPQQPQDSNIKIQKKKIQIGNKIYKKKIQKQKHPRKKYEPVNDNGKMYIYENDPKEYMKARKRIQNRISAVRVRSRNKKYYSQVEKELQRMIQENCKLKIKTAQFAAENTILKQQISFLENIVMNSNKISEEAKTQALTQEFKQQSILPVTMPKQDDQKINQKYIPNIVTNNGKQYIYRVGKPKSMQKQFIFFGVLTILLCVFGVQQVGQGQSISSPDILTGFQPLNVDHKTNFDNRSKNWNEQINKLIKQNNNYRVFVNIGWYSFLIFYIIYMVYLGLKWRYQSVKHFKIKMARKLLNVGSWKKE